MGRSIKISNETMEFVENEAKVQNRSLSWQVEYWLKLGRSIESSP